MESLDNILSGGGTTSAPAEVKQETTEQVGSGEVEQALPEAGTDEGRQSEGGQKTVPQAALHAEKVKVKRYTEEVSGFREEIGGLKNANAQLVQELRQLTATMQRPRSEPKPPPDIFENAPGAILHTVEPHLNEMRSTNVYNSRLIAEVRHTEDAVKAADAAFSHAYQSGQLDPADYQRVISSPNIYDAAVKWHKRVLAQQEIGDDPAAYKERLKAELKAELEQAAQGTTETVTNGATRPAVMPSNLATARNVGARSGPAWAGPTPLANIFKR
jgi:hypothetical protein